MTAVSVGALTEGNARFPEDLNWKVAIASTR